VDDARDDFAMKVLVTGGGGFIESHLVDRLLTVGHRVKVLDNFATGRRENLLSMRDGIELVEGDITSYERVNTAVQGCEVVLHQAALSPTPRSVQDPLTSNAVNVTCTLNVLLAARDSHVRRVVLGSSSSVYGASPDLPKREAAPAQPIAPYAVAKLACEGYCRSFSEVYGLETMSLRYFNVFGPRQDPLLQYAAVIPNFILAALRGERPVVFGDGEQSRDFTFVENVGQANLLALTAPDAGGATINVACGEECTINGLLRMLSDGLNLPLEPPYQEQRAGEVRHFMADIALAREMLGYRPQVDIREGLRRTLRFFEQHGKSVTLPRRASSAR
jgi:nucleoside-diphosphate-sugar epimerase